MTTPYAVFRSGILLLLVGICTVGIRTANAGLPAMVAGQPLPSLADMVEKVVPAVVNIATSTRIDIPEHPLLSDPFFRQFFDIPWRKRQSENKSLGSGVVVNAKAGLIVTNRHVIDKAAKIAVTVRNGHTTQARLVGVDPETDVAIIQVSGMELHDLPLGNSDKLRVGDFVVAVGNPFGLGQTVTSGIVSALGRKGLGIEGYEDFIQTDASINPGNSGGALVNLAGELIGINTAILARGGGNIGIGFAIPINMVRRITSQLVEYGEVRRGLLGIQAQDLTDALASAFGLKQHEGAVITRIEPNSAAHKAGLKSGDIIISANSRAIRDAADLRTVIGLSRIGEKVSLTFLRDGEKKQATAVVEEPEPFRISGENVDRRLEGAILESREKQHEKKSIVVLSVKPQSAAWVAGLRPGDRILSANRRIVTTFEELAAVVRSNDRQMLLNIQRGDEGFFILVR